MHFAPVIVTMIITFFRGTDVLFSASNIFEHEKTIGTQYLHTRAFNKTNVIVSNYEDIIIAVIY